MCLTVRCLRSFFMVSISLRKHELGLVVPVVVRSPCSLWFSPWLSEVCLRTSTATSDQDYRLTICSSTSLFYSYPIRIIPSHPCGAMFLLQLTTILAAATWRTMISVSMTLTFRSSPAGKDYVWVCRSKRSKRSTLGGFPTLLTALLQLRHTSMMIGKNVYWAGYMQLSYPWRATQHRLRAWAS